MKLTTAITALLLTAQPVLADEHMADINDYNCREILLANGDERDLAIMFLQGYFVGKSGQTAFDRNQLAEATDLFLDMCIDSPDQKVVDTMGKALKQAMKPDE